MRRDDSAVLLDIAHAAALIAKFLIGKDKTTFFVDELTQSAVLHQILVLGEAAKRLSPEFRSRHSNVPWSEMAGMRDKLIHAYEAVDYDEVWRTATKDIPELLEWVTPLLPEKPA
jgi:uncharacterized protein with HEPN domain